MEWKTLVATSGSQRESELCELLGGMGIPYHVAHNGTELLAQVYQEPFRLILLDASLTDMDGFSACRQLRALEWLQDTPIIMLTEDWEEDTVLQVYQSKANDFLVFPLQSRLLREKVKMWQERWSLSSHENQESHTSLPPVGAIERGVLVGGRYRIIEEVGRGGMGAVYQVWDERLQIDLAMKVVSTHDWKRSEEVQQRFQREVESLAKIRHPNVVRIYDTAQWDRFRYFTMEHLPNGTLHALCAEGRALSPHQALQLVSEVADALAYTHQKGIIHRDLKSTNILLSEAEHPIIIDFGSMLPSEQTHTRLTPGEFVIGTPYFMAPEQLTDPEGVDYRCDIYSLGAVLFELLTGQVPFQGRDINEAMIAVVQEGIPAPRAVVPQIDEKLSELCLRATAYQPESRFQSAEEFSQACQQLIAELRISSPHQLPALRLTPPQKV